MIIGKTLFLHFMSADNIITFQSQGSSDFFVNILIKIEPYHLLKFFVDFFLVVEVITKGIKKLSRSYGRIAFKDFLDIHS